MEASDDVSLLLAFSAQQDPRSAHAENFSATSYDDRRDVYRGSGGGLEGHYGSDAPHELPQHAARAHASVMMGDGYRPEGTFANANATSHASPVRVHPLFTSDGDARSDTSTQHQRYAAALASAGVPQGQPSYAMDPAGGHPSAPTYLSPRGVRRSLEYSPSGDVAWDGQSQPTYGTGHVPVSLVGGPEQNVRVQPRTLYTQMLEGEAQPNGYSGGLLPPGGSVPWLQSDVHGHSAGPQRAQPQGRPEHVVGEHSGIAARALREGQRLTSAQMHARSQMLQAAAQNPQRLKDLQRHLHQLAQRQQAEQQQQQLDQQQQAAYSFVAAPSLGQIFAGGVPQHAPASAASHLHGSAQSHGYGAQYAGATQAQFVSQPTVASMSAQQEALRAGQYASAVHSQFVTQTTQHGQPISTQAAQQEALRAAYGDMQAGAQHAGQQYATGALSSQVMSANVLSRAQSTPSQSFPHGLPLGAMAQATYPHGGTVQTAMPQGLTLSLGSDAQQQHQQQQMSQHGLGDNVSSSSLYAGHAGVDASQQQSPFVLRVSESQHAATVAQYIARGQPAQQSSHYYATGFGVGTTVGKAPSSAATAPDFTSVPQRKRNAKGQQRRRAPAVRSDVPEFAAMMLQQQLALVPSQKNAGVDATNQQKDAGLDAPMVDPSMLRALQQQWMYAPQQQPSSLAHDGSALLDAQPTRGLLGSVLNDALQAALLANAMRPQQDSLPWKGDAKPPKPPKGKGRAKKAKGGDALVGAEGPVVVGLDGAFGLPGSNGAPVAGATVEEATKKRKRVYKPRPRKVPKTEGGAPAEALAADAVTVGAPQRVIVESAYGPVHGVEGALGVSGAGAGDGGVPAAPDGRKKRQKKPRDYEKERLARRERKRRERERKRELKLGKRPEKTGDVVVVKPAKITVAGALARGVKGRREAPATVEGPPMRIPEDHAWCPAVSAPLNVHVTCYKCASTAAEGDGDLVQCRLCGEPYHRYCADIPHGKPIPANWRCVGCVLCDMCGKAAPADELIVCDSCGRGFHHKKCHIPSVATLPDSAWRCSDCAVCVGCWTRETREWMFDGTHCQDCGRSKASGRCCPVCKIGYPPQRLGAKRATGPSAEMIQCADCETWVHYNCAGLTDARLSQFLEDDSLHFRCPPCADKHMATLAQDKGFLRLFGSPPDVFHGFTPRDLSMELGDKSAKFQHLLRQVMQQKRASYFAHVPSREEFPDYYDIVTCPMDLSTVLRKVDAKEYYTVALFHADIALIARNCLLYNGADDLLSTYALGILQWFDRKLCETFDGFKPPRLDLADIVATRNEDQSRGDDGAAPDSEGSEKIAVAEQRPLSAAPASEAGPSDVAVPPAVEESAPASSLLGGAAAASSAGDAAAASSSVGDGGAATGETAASGSSPAEWTGVLALPEGWQPPKGARPIGGPKKAPGKTKKKPGRRKKKADALKDAAVAETRASGTTTPDVDAAAAEMVVDAEVRRGSLRPRRGEQQPLPPPAANIAPPTVVVEAPANEPPKAMEAQAGDQRRCALCGGAGDQPCEKAGRLLWAEGKEWVHAACIVWSSEVTEDADGILWKVDVALSRGRHMKCRECGKSGATLGCNEGKCKATFHYACAEAAGAVFFGDHTLYCKEHGKTVKKEKVTKALRTFDRPLVCARTKDWPASCNPKGLPARCGALLVVAYGRVVPRRAFYSRELILPVGYRALRVYWSVADPSKLVTYECVIESGVERGETVPMFVARTDDGYCAKARTADGVWDQIYKGINDSREARNPDHLRSLVSHRGAWFFGLSLPAVVHAIELLRWAEYCPSYIFRFTPRRPLLVRTEVVSAQGMSAARCSVYVRKSRVEAAASESSKIRAAFQSGQLGGGAAASFQGNVQLPIGMQYRQMKENRWQTTVRRSGIHGWGLFACRDFDAGEIIIEYVGEIIRESVADMREARYDAQGIGCYMFRLDELTVVDATMRGNAARYCNHCCEPNCYTRICPVDGTRRILFFTSRKITAGEEFTVDYQMPFEDAKIPCRCGAPSCRGTLN